MATKVVPIRLTQEATDALAKRATEHMETPTGLAARLVLEGLERMDKAAARKEALALGKYADALCIHCEGEKEATRPNSTACRFCNTFAGTLLSPAAIALREEAEELRISRLALVTHILAGRYEKRAKRRKKKEGR